MRKRDFIFDAVDGMDSGERSTVKGSIMSQFPLGRFEKRGYQIDVTDGPHAIDGGVEVTILARRGGREVIIDNPLRFYNPPVNVPDGDGFREDPEEALEEIITQVVESQDK